MRWYVAPLVLSVNPLVIVIGANAGREPLNGGVVAGSLLAVLGATIVALWALRVLQRDLAARATWLAWFLILFNLYGASLLALRRLQLLIWEDDPAFAVPYVVTCGVLAAIISRPWESRTRSPGVLTVVAGLLLVVGLAPAAEGLRPASASQPEAPGPWWRPPADNLIASALSDAPRSQPAPVRDIYYIVLDGLGSADTLRRTYGVDLQPIAAALTARGFYVVDGARANYAQTYLSLASTLNMGYLDEVARVLGPRTDNRNPLRYLIQKNALMQMASRAGYRVVVVGSGWAATERFDSANICLCTADGLHEFQLAAITQTPLAAVPAGWWARDPYDVHRDTIVGALEALEAGSPAPAPVFVFAHLLAPHPPFVLGRDGSPRRADRPFTLESWRRFGGSRDEYITGYGDQAHFVMQRLVAAIDALLSRPGPPPAIVVHGDHGPGSLMRWDGPNDASVRERMDIFAAYYFPGGHAALYPAMTPVNGARLLARQYLGAELSPLPDRALFSNGDRPYAFVPVP